MRQMIANKKVSSLQELAGTPVRSNRNPVAQATISALGMRPVVAEVEDLLQIVLDGQAEGGETNYPRMYPLRQNEVTKSVIDTGHSLFLTSMIIGDKFWSTLSADVQAVIKQAAVEAERAETIRDGQLAEQRLKAEGATIVKWSPEQRDQARRDLSAVYKQFENLFSPGMVDRIQRL
jgi:TRAP-type C4-dicarboxylate transport system substrate-binding protein